MRWQSGTLRVAILTNIANIRENSEQKFKYDGKGIRFESGDLDRNGEFGENSEFGEHSPRC